jgi:hypothetical protein
MRETSRKEVTKEYRNMDNIEMNFEKVSYDVNWLRI